MIDENNASVEITRVRKSLNAVLDDPQISGVLGSEFVSELKEWDALIGKKMDEPFTLVILGEFKRGKSTIINAILGKDLTTDKCHTRDLYDKRDILRQFQNGHGFP